MKIVDCHLEMRDGPYYVLSTPKFTGKISQKAMKFVVFTCESFQLYSIYMYNVENIHVPFGLFHVELVEDISSHSGSGCGCKSHHWDLVCVCVCVCVCACVCVCV